MANIITAPESGIYFDGNTAGVADIPTLTGNASGVAIQYDGYAGIEINSSATGANYLDRFSVEGANGRLFGVTDEITGTVFSVNDAAGLPIIEVESTSDYDKITIGEYGTDALVVSGSSVQIAGSTAATQAWVSSQEYISSVPTTLSGDRTIGGDLTVSGNQVLTAGSNADVKYAVWNGTQYGIGMTSGVTYGGLNDYAMTFCMNNDTDRGFWWGYSGQTKSSGAMSLTTAGVLTVSSSIKVGST